MKKILQLTKALTFTLAVVIMLSSNVLTAHAETMLVGMKKTEYGIMTTSGQLISADNKTKRSWTQSSKQPGYPYCEVIKTYTKTLSNGKTREVEGTFLECYLTDYINTHEESEWPSFVIKGTDGRLFYLSKYDDERNDGFYFTKWCYDEKSGWWFRDEAYKGAKVPSYGWSDEAIAKAEAEATQMIEDLKEDIANGNVVENGEPVKPVVPDYINDVIDSESPDAPTQNLSGSTGDDDNKGDDDKDPYEDVNTLGATVTLKTDCIKVKTNKKGVVAQKPLPKSVKVGKKALKKNKTFTVSYEKYTDSWKTVDAVTDEGIYRLVVTGKNGYEGVCTKRLYVTADKKIKAMSSVSVKVKKMAYTGKPITSDVIKTAKIGKRTLTEGTEYTVTYTNNTDSGTAQVTLTAKEGSGLLGTKTVNFTITGNKMSKVKVAGISSITYSPDTDLTQDMSKVKLTCGSDTLKENTDFTVSYLNNTKAGTAKIVFTGKGLYNGTLTKSFKIAKAKLSEIMLEEASKKIEVTYTGKAIKPEVTLKNGDTTLKKGTDYTLTYKNNVKVSTDAKSAQITIKGKGNYTGTLTVKFSIIANNNDNTGKSNSKNVKPDADEPTEKEPVADESTEEEPVTEEPEEEEPVADAPTEEEPDADAPTEEEPDAEEPTEDEPVEDEPVVDEPVADEPTGNEPVTDDPTGDEPVTDDPTGDEPVADEPIGDEPVANDPTGDEPVIDDPTGDAPVIDVPTGRETVTDEQAVETISTVETTEQ